MSLLFISICNIVKGAYSLDQPCLHSVSIQVAKQTCFEQHTSTNASQGAIMDFESRTQITTRKVEGKKNKQRRIIMNQMSVSPCLGRRGLARESMEGHVMFQMRLSTFSRDISFLLCHSRVIVLYYYYPT